MSSYVVCKNCISIKGEGVLLSYSRANWAMLKNQTHLANFFHDTNISADIYIYPLATWNTDMIHVNQMAKCRMEMHVFVAPETLIFFISHVVKIPIC